MPRAKPLPDHEKNCPACGTVLRLRRRGRTEPAVLAGFIIALAGVGAAIVLPIVADQLVTHATSRTPTMIAGAAFGVALLAFGVYTAIAGPFAWRCDTCAHALRWQRAPRPVEPKRLYVKRPAEQPQQAPPIDAAALGLTIPPGAVLQTTAANGQPVIIVMPQQPAFKPGHCVRCNTPLRWMRGSPSSGTVLVGVVGMVLALMFCASGIGFVIGVPLLIVSAILGSIGEKRLKCPTCSA
ncbi:MAG TPA: hypothetical protein VFF65_07565 [Phycisphaerales bacterium]|nr:hypothetical protein [Phycisphaerales bacterium]